ncbi:MAG TPA: hypothetical protein VG388_07620 [Solirubrobacteraceae bacterium]|jgi:hypothetical protein|nr:hypothetical protein [Solirubrobacteraceae bacterium]
MPRARSGRRPPGAPCARSVLAILLALALSGCATIDRDDLAAYVEQVRSAAAEGAILAGVAERHQTPTIFVWLHSAELHHNVETVAEKLAGETPAPAVKADIPQAQVLVDAVAGAFHLLHRLPADAAAAHRAREKLLSEAQVAERLSGELQ